MDRDLDQKWRRRGRSERGREGGREKEQLPIWKPSILDGKVFVDQVWKDLWNGLVLEWELNFKGTQTQNTEKMEKWKNVFKNGVGSSNLRRFHLDKNGNPQLRSPRPIATASVSVHGHDISKIRFRQFLFISFHSFHAKLSDTDPDKQCEKIDCCHEHCDDHSRESNFEELIE
jgi:hypothetical protein